MLQYCVWGVEHDAETAWGIGRAQPLTKQNEVVKAPQKALGGWCWVIWGGTGLFGAGRWGIGDRWVGVERRGAYTMGWAGLDGPG